MACEAGAEKLAAFIEGDLPPAEAQRLEAHLAACVDCRAIADALVKTRQLVGSLEQVEVPPWLAPRILSRVRAEREAGPFRRWLRPLRFAIPATACATILMVGIAVYLFKALEPERLPARRAPTGIRSEAQPAAPSSPQPLARPEQASRLPAPARRAVDGAKPAEPREEVPAAGGEVERKTASRDGRAAPMAPAPVPQGTAALADKSEREALHDRLGTAKEAAPSLDAAPPQTAARARAFSAPSLAAEPRYRATIRQQDVPRAADLVNDILVRAGAKRIVRSAAGGEAVITAEVDGGQVQGIRERLQALGDFREQDTTPPGHDESLPLRIEILPAPSHR